MSKKMTPLQALKKVKQARYFVDFELDAKVGEDYKEELKIVESALKELKVKREIIRDILTADDEKKFKAFDIIKKKNVDVSGIKRAIKVAINNKATLVNAMTKEFIEPYIYYNMSRPKSEWLTQEEFDLLKEMLL